jgi:hypothetical protein
MLMNLYTSRGKGVLYCTAAQTAVGLELQCTCDTGSEQKVFSA